MSTGTLDGRRIEVLWADVKQHLVGLIAFQQRQHVARGLVDGTPPATSAGAGPGSKSPNSSGAMDSDEELQLLKIDISHLPKEIVNDPIAVKCYRQMVVFATAQMEKTTHPPKLEAAVIFLTVKFFPSRVTSKLMLLNDVWKLSSCIVQFVSENSPFTCLSASVPVT